MKRQPINAVHFNMAILIGAFGFGAMACEDKPKSSDTDAVTEERAASKEQAQKPAAEAKPEPATATPQATEHMLAALGQYESIRGLLAKDEKEGLAAAADELAAAADKAAAAADGEMKGTLRSIASAARELKSKAASDLDQARLAFGTVSKHVVSLVSSYPKLQEGRHVFECPMAEGYKKWIQEDKELNNPYMGKKMLECGAATDWST